MMLFALKTNISGFRGQAELALSRNGIPGD
jgi:hypothetical protein